MLLHVGIVQYYFSQLVYPGEIKVHLLSNFQYLFTLLVVNKLTFVIKKLQRVPFGRIMAGRQNDPTTRLFHRNGKLYGGCGRQSEIDDIDPDTLKRADHQVANHLARNTRIATDDNGIISSILLD